MMKKITACTLDCPDACSLVVSEEAGGGIEIRGNPAHPFTSGFTCSKIKHHVRRLRSSHRVVHPMIKTAQRWQTISWDAALDLCAENIQKFRPQSASILHFHGEGAKGVLKQASKLFFARLGASRVRGSLCDAAGYIAHLKDFGSRNNNDIRDLLNAAQIVNWGKDLARSSVHTAAIVRKARRQGARVVTISPGGDGNESFSDASIRIRPGTDRLLAAAVMHLLIERGDIPQAVTAHAKQWTEFRSMILEHDPERLLAACEVTRQDLERLYQFYADNNPTATLVGAGLQRYAYGGENVRFINALAFVSGNIGRAGGGSYFHHHSLKNLNLAWTMDPEKKPRRALRMPLIGPDILAAGNPPIRMIWVNGSNLINQAPDTHQTIRAFEGVEFKVVVDAFMTDTAERADLVLPSTLMFEQEDIISSYLHDYVHYVRAVLEAPGQARSDFQILADLGKRLNPPLILPDAETCLRESLKTPHLAIALEALRKQEFIRATAPEIAYAGLRFDHSDGKYRFPLTLHEEPASPAGFPLRLLTLIRRDAIHSQILPEDHKQPPVLWIAPDSTVLEEIDIKGQIQMVSPVGRLRVRVHILPGLHPGVVLYRRGDWMKLGGGANQLIAARLTDIGNGAPFYEQYVRLENI